MQQRYGLVQLLQFNVFSSAVCAGTKQPKQEGKVLEIPNVSISKWR